MKRLITCLSVFGTLAYSAAGAAVAAKSERSNGDVEYIVVLSEVAVWEDTIPSDKDMKIYFDVDKAMAYLFALYGDATMEIFSPYGLWKQSSITDPDIATKVETDLPAVGSYHMLPAGSDSGEYYMILTKKERNKIAPFTIVQYTVYKFEKPLVEEEQPEKEAGAPAPTD
ncbi:MAG: hypothetical protein JSW52_10350 [Candidatus Coatesbacteria bacterium]|nr:MAG: hypothetical protein JSW52_10350 [Candidatus Coatesbacteria bacterium]